MGSCCLGLTVYILTKINVNLYLFLNLGKANHLIFKYCSKLLVIWLLLKINVLQQVPSIFRRDAVNNNLFREPLRKPKYCNLKPYVMSMGLRRFNLT